MQSSRQRSERLIVLGRAVLAGLSLLAIWLDPSEPAKYAQATYSLLAAYLAYALLLAAWAWTAGLIVVRVAPVTHAIDGLIFTALIYLTEGPTSPFFVFFVFSLFAAALRWQWQGVLWTAFAILVIYLGLGIYVAEIARDPGFELNRFMIRSVYLAVVAVLLAYLSAHEQLLRKELADLAAWPRHKAPGSLVEAALRHAAIIFGAQRLVMVWEKVDEPGRCRAELIQAVFKCLRDPATPAEPLVAEALAASDFLCLNASSARPTTLYMSASGLRRWHGTPLGAGFPARPTSASILSVGIAGDQFQGRLFVLDRPGLTTDDLILGGLVARQIAADLDQFYIRERLQQAAVSEERARFAGELHDGVLQVLAGLGLQLEALRRLLAVDPDAARARVAEIQQLVDTEQRDLRFFMRQMSPQSLSHIDLNLLPYLRGIGERAEHQWNLQVKVTAEPIASQLSRRLVHAVYRIVQEALANAARHGRAREVSIDIGIRDNRLHLEIADDGRGFPFCGRYDLAVLNRNRQGPESIKARVASLDGGLVVESCPSGTRLEIDLPLHPAQQVPSTSALVGRVPSANENSAGKAG